MWLDSRAMQIGGALVLAGIGAGATAMAGQPLLVAPIALLCTLLVCSTVSLHRQNQRKQADHNGREALLRNALLASPVGMALLGAGGDVEVANEPYLQALGGRALPSALEPDMLVSGAGGRSFRVRTSALKGATSLQTVEDVTEVADALQRDREHELELHLHKAVAAILADTDSLDDAVPRLLETVGTVGGWSVGLHWTVERDELYCRHVWHRAAEYYPDFLQACRASPVPRGVGLLGTVWEERRTHWLSEAGHDTHILRSLKAQREGLGCAVAFPLLVLDRVFGVMEFWGREGEQPEPALVAALDGLSGLLGAQLGRYQEREWAAEQLRASEEQYRTITEIAKDAILSMDVEGRIISVNRAAEQLFGYNRAELMGRPMAMLVPEELRRAHVEGFARFVATGNRTLRWDGVELPGLRRDGSRVLLEISLAESFSGGQRVFTGYMRDITARKQEETQLVYQALHDALTDLPNRVLLQERLERALATRLRHRAPLALLFMDLDRFKEVNDTFGHHAGDLLLQQVSIRLLQTLRESDTVARLGGDEFALLMPVTDEEGATQAADRIVEILRQPFTILGQNLQVGASIGIVVAPDHGEDAATLMRRADVAMYAAKRSAADFAVYSPDRDEANAMRLVLTNELRHAIDHDQLLLYYQPKIDLRNGQVTDVEALIRWQHPQRGFISPDGFIPLAEETGLVSPLTLWVLREAMRQQRIWQDAGLVLRVSVNFSARTLHEPTLVESIQELLLAQGVDARYLQVEITESALMLDPERALETLSRLRGMGVSTAIDDFGTGYSSLGYLKTLPIDEIKIDKSFVMDMATNRDDTSIVHSVVTLGHNLRLQVVAEGVDNKRTLDMLTAMGCDMAQGFHLSRPVPAFELERWIERRMGGLQQAG